ncbi:MAG: ribosome biogenesis GTPase Der [Planctomycetota bacterium]|nr:ribosome biogenesis GTPase Der [Planctomycetota bacterium]
MMRANQADHAVPAPQSVVAIVGRPNVGKSSLFNALVGMRAAIVDPTPGTTRDAVARTVTEAGRTFELVDTAGMIGDADDKIEKCIQRQVALALETATLVVFAVDASEGVTGADNRIAARLRSARAQVVVVANKIDRKSAMWTVAEVHRLGLGEPFLVSAAHRTGIRELKRAIAARLPQQTVSVPAAPPVIRIAVLGRQNVGKSTLVNRLARQERVLVDSTPGTTRDAVEVRCGTGDAAFIAVDTAGLKKKGTAQTTIDLWSRHRTFMALRQADVALFLTDATEKIGEIDKRIAADIVENTVPCVVCVNKWDLARGKAVSSDYRAYLDRMLPALSFAPISVMSALDGTNVANTVKVARELVKQSRTRIGTGQLNQVLRRITESYSPQSVDMGLARVYFATQVGVAPVHIVLFVNNPRKFSRRYLSFLKQRLRSMLPFAEVPIRLSLRGRPEKRDFCENRKDFS